MWYFQSLGSKSAKYMQAYTDCHEEEELAKGIIKLAYASVADTAIIQMQDILLKDNKARINLPSTIGQNWRWRLKEGEFNSKEIEELFNLADIYYRLPEIVYRKRAYEERRAEQSRKGIRKAKGKRIEKGKRTERSRKKGNRKRKA